MNILYDILTLPVYAWIAGMFLLGLLSYKAKYLDLGGMISAVIIGSLIVISGSSFWLIPLIVFFLLSSILTSISSNTVHQKSSERSSRTYQQVVANGGLAALLALVYYVFPNAVFQIAFLGSLAAATSDTWSTEIGSFSRKEPILITNLKKVSKGTSGAISLSGSIGGIIGALALAFSGIVLFAPEFRPDYFEMGLGVVIAGGIIGNISDTVLGATIQAKYKCVVCGKDTEELEHCQKPVLLISGFEWLDNEKVNFICTFVGALSAALLYYLFK